MGGQVHIGGYGCSNAWQRRYLAEFGRGCYKAVALASDGLHESGLLRVIAQSVSDFSDGGVDAMLGIDKDLAAPEMLGNFISGDELALSLHQQDEQFQRLSFELHRTAATRQFKAATIQPEFPELESCAHH